MRTCLQNFSNTEFMTAGAAYGAGVYTANNVGYIILLYAHGCCCLCICETSDAASRALPALTGHMRLFLQKV